MSATHGAAWPISTSIGRPPAGSFLPPGVRPGGHLLQQLGDGRVQLLLGAWPAAFDPVTDDPLVVDQDEGRQPLDLPLPLDGADGAVPPRAPVEPVFLLD